MIAYLKNLLSINRNTLRFLHDVEGFDFEKPYFITEQPGKFTVNTVVKAVQTELNPDKCKIALFVVPTASRGNDYIYFATLQHGKFDGRKKEGVSYFDYCVKERIGDLDYCWSVKDFEQLRKNYTEKVFVIAQDKAYITAITKKNIDVSARFTLINARKHGDGRGNSYIGEMSLESTDGSRTRYEYNPYSTFYGYEVKSGSCADFIDKSGYLLRPHRFELMQKAERLGKERKQVEADNADFTEATAELQELIDKARGILSGSVMACNDASTAKKLSDKMETFARVLSYFSDYSDKLTAKKYASIDRIKADIDRMKEKLNYCIN